MKEMSRRAWLAGTAAGGAALALEMALLRHALAAGAVGKGVSRLRGDVRLNGKPARRGMQVRPGDVITTGPGAELVAVVGRDAFLVRTRHHDEPRYIYRKGMPRMMEKAPVVNHTDAELILLESLVGRKPPFTASKY
jgi:ribosomal 50S subunit-recycling heat shock protein